MLLLWPVVAAALVSAAAQQPAAPVPAVAGAVSGVVVSAEDDAPLARARVTLTSAGLPAARVVLSDARGAFQFTNLPEGVYSLSATRTGFTAESVEDVRVGREAPAPIRIELARAGLIVGRLLDEDGTPFSGAAIDALIARTENEQRTLVSVASAWTDDRGQFRLTGLRDGRYFVSAADPAFADVGDETGTLRYGATYYPGVVLPAEAERVAVVPGIEPKPIEFRLRLVRPARVSGRLVAESGRPLLSAALVFSPDGAEDFGALAADVAEFLPDGRFAFRNVPPGRYRIRARGETEHNGDALFGTYVVTVDGRDLANIVMTLAPGATLEGVVEAKGHAQQRPDSYAGVRVRAPLADGSNFGDALTGDVQKSGRFRIRGLMRGQHVITIVGLPFPWTLEGVTIRERDVTDAPLVIDGTETVRDVRITITDTTTQLSGLVRTRRGLPAAGALVLAVPRAPQHRTRTSRHFRIVRSAADGRYQVRGLPPGEYLVVAVGDLDERDVRRPDVLAALTEDAIPVSLAERESRTLDLTLATVAGSAAVVR